MYSLECKCKIANRWNEVEGMQFDDLMQAIHWARYVSMERRTPVRVMDLYGRQVWPL